MASKELMKRVAELTFVDGKNLKQIAEILFAEDVISSNDIRHVSPILDEAGQWLLQEHANLQEKKREDSPEKHLAERLKTRYGLLDARVVPGGDEDYASLMRRYGRCAAQYFDDLPDEELHVAVSGGQTVLDLVSHLPERRRPNVYYYGAALIGRGHMTKTAHVGPEVNATIAWSRSGRLPGRLYYSSMAPYDLIPEELSGMNKREKHEYVRKAIMQQLDAIKRSIIFTDILDHIASKVTIALAGLGVVHAEPKETEQITVLSLLKHIDAEILEAEGVVGEISYCMFGAEGCGDPRWEFFLTAGDNSDHAGVEFYKHLVSQEKKVIVCAGIRKEAAIIPAIDNELFNVLVTDAVTAERLLKR